MTGKKKIQLVLFLVLLTIPSLVFGIDTKLSMEFWGRMTYEKVGEKIPTNYLSLERGYFSMEPTFTGNLKGRFTIDIFSTDETYQTVDKITSTDTDHTFPVDSLSITSTSKKGTVDGAGLKIKYAYVDYLISPLANIIPESRIQVGMIKTYFGTIYDWEYITIDKDPVDKYKVANSSDFGIAYSGFLPSGLGEVELAVYNGEGYKKVMSNVNNEYAYVGNLRITPLPGVMVGGSYMMNSVGNEKVNNTPTAASPAVIELPNASHQELNMSAIVAKLSYKPVDVWFEMLNQTAAKPNVSGSADVKSSGMMIMPIVKMKSLIGTNLDILVRYDSWDPNTDVDKDVSTDAQMKYTTTTLGLNWNMLVNDAGDPAVMIQANYMMKKFDKEIVNKIYDTNTFLLQLRWKFSNLLNL